MQEFLTIAKEIQGIQADEGEEYSYVDSIN